MGLKNMSLLDLAAISATGGTPCVFADDGVTVPNGVHLIVPADSDYQLRRSATVKTRPATFNPVTGTYGKDKKSISFTVPDLMPDGKIVFNVIRVEREVWPGSSEVNVSNMNKIAAQLLTDSDLDNFWATGSLS